MGNCENCLYESNENYFENKKEKNYLDNKVKDKINGKGILEEKIENILLIM